MATINVESRWAEDVNLIARGEKVEGGRGGGINVQAKQLADRTEYLKQAVDEISESAAENVKVALSFLTGGTLDSGRDEIMYGIYRMVWTGTFPKVVPAGSTPASTGKVGPGAWAYSSDAAMRKEMADDVIGPEMMGFHRKKLSVAVSNLSKIMTGDPWSAYEFMDRITNKNGSEDHLRWDWTPAVKALLDKAKTWMDHRVDSGIVYRNLAIHIPGGNYLLSETMTLTDQTTSTRAYESTSLKIYGDGKNSSVFQCGKEKMTLMHLYNIKVHMSDVGFQGFGGGETSILLKLGTEDGLYPAKNSVFENLSFKYARKNLLIAHAYDCKFDNIDINGLPAGEKDNETTAVEILPVQTDNSNNLFFDKLHIEGCYGRYTTLLKARKPLKDGSYHHTLGFANLHIETRRYDAVNIDLDGVITSELSGLHLISNNTNGKDITYKDSGRIIRITRSYNIRFRGGYIDRPGDAREDMIPPILHEGDVKGIIYDGLRLRSGNTDTLNIDSYLTNNSNDVFMLTSCFWQCIFSNFDTSFPVTTLLKVSSPKSINRSHYLTVDANGNLIFSYSNAPDGLTNTQIARLSPAGDLAPKSLCVPSVMTIAPGSSVTYVLPNPGGNNPSKRGLVTLIAKHSVTTGTIMFTTTGAQVLEHINGGLYKISAASGNVNGYVNVSLSGANLLIQNLTANTVVLGVHFLHFMD